MKRTLLMMIAAASSAATLSACVNPNGPNGTGGSRGGATQSLPPFAPHGDPFFDPAAAAAAQSGCAEAWDSAHGDAGGRHVRPAPRGADAQYWDPESGRYRSVRDQFERAREMHGPRYGVHGCIFEGQRTVVQDGG